MRATTINKFHGTEAEISIKREYSEGFSDCLAMLDYEVYYHGRDAEYAKRKLKEIKNKLCGAADCKCTSTLK